VKIFKVGAPEVLVIEIVFVAKPEFEIVDVELTALWNLSAEHEKDDPFHVTYSPAKHVGELIPIVLVPVIDIPLEAVSKLAKLDQAGVPVPCEIITSPRFP
jgi:hypothetical protein